MCSQLIHPALLRRVIVLQLRQTFRIETCPKWLFLAQALFLICLVALYYFLDMVSKFAMFKSLWHGSYNVTVVVMFSWVFAIRNRCIFDFECWALGYMKAYLALTVSFSISELLLWDCPWDSITVFSHWVCTNMIAIIIIFLCCVDWCLLPITLRLSKFIIYGCGGCLKNSITMLKHLPLYSLLSLKKHSCARLLLKKYLEIVHSVADERSALTEYSDQIDFPPLRTY